MINVEKVTKEIQEETLDKFLVFIMERYDNPKDCFYDMAREHTVEMVKILIEDFKEGLK